MIILIYRRDELDVATNFDLRPTVERKSGKNGFTIFKLPRRFSRPIVIRSACALHRQKRPVETNPTVPGSRPYDRPFGRYEFFSPKPLKIAKFFKARVWKFYRKKHKIQNTFLPTSTDAGEVPLS
jgi:hypothetical protein